MRATSVFFFEVTFIIEFKQSKNLRSVPFTGAALRDTLVDKMMSSGDARFFSSTKKGEVAEWRAELNHPDRDTKKDAVKKCVAAMTVGKDVSMLFTDVVNCMQTDNVELKKLVYLYLINYAKTQPDLAILAVNTFVKVRVRLISLLQRPTNHHNPSCKPDRTTTPRPFFQDTQDPNPLIRALAVRTMGCIRVNKITEYLCDPLQRTLAVRK